MSMRLTGRSPQAYADRHTAEKARVILQAKYTGVWVLRDVKSAVTGESVGFRPVCVSPHDWRETKNSSESGFICHNCLESMSREETALNGLPATGCHTLRKEKP